MSDTESLPDKQAKNAVYNSGEVEVPAGAVRLIKTRDSGGIANSSIRIEGSEHVLYSLRHTGPIGVDIYRGYKLPDEPGSSTLIPDTVPASLVATIHFTTVDYVDPKLPEPVKIPESTFLYSKKWYKLNRYFRVEGREFVLRGSPFMGTSVHVFPADWPKEGKPLATFEPSLRPKIQRIMTINTDAIYEGDPDLKPEVAMLANGMPTVLFDNILIADYIFRCNRRRRQATYGHGGGGP